MLQNPAWDRPNLYRNETLKAWLRKQPADGVYDFQSASWCLMGQYFDACGCPHERTYYDMPNYLEIASAKPWTFGDALKRLEAV